MEGLEPRLVVLNVGSNDIHRYLPEHLLESGGKTSEEFNYRLGVAVQRVANSTQAVAMQLLKVSPPLRR